VKTGAAKRGKFLYLERFWGRFLKKEKICLVFSKPFLPLP
jgi:hypothetical protein